jgi:hypothetical protein
VQIGELIGVFACKDEPELIAILPPALLKGLTSTSLR